MPTGSLAKLLNPSIKFQNEPKQNLNCSVWLLCYKYINLKKLLANTMNVNYIKQRCRERAAVFYKSELREFFSNITEVNLNIINDNIALLR